MKTEIAFWDTSALLPLCCVKAGVTNRSRALFRRFKRPVVWWATQIEIRSALARLRQDEDLTDRQVHDAIKRSECGSFHGRAIERVAFVEAPSPDRSSRAFGDR